MSNTVLATVVAIPALIFAVFIAYQLGDYLDPDEPAHASRTAYEYVRERHEEPTLQQKFGRGLKHAAIGTGAVVAIPVAGFIGLVLHILASKKRGGGGSGYYPD